MKILEAITSRNPREWRLTEFKANCLGQDQIEVCLYAQGSWMVNTEAPWVATRDVMSNKNASKLSKLFDYGNTTLEDVAKMMLKGCAGVWNER